MIRTGLMIALCALPFAACSPAERDDGGDSDSGDSDGDSGDSDHTDSDDSTLPDGDPSQAMKCNKMDLMFVVDDSNSMQQEQSNLATNFPQFANVLSTYTTADGDPIDYRIAVTTTGKDFTLHISGVPIAENDHGPDGAFMDNCDLTKRWIEPTDPDASGKLACRANVGIDGSSEEMPLLMTKHALSERVADGTNAGFLRDDALLGVIMMTDEDDSSLTANEATVSTSHPELTPDFQPADLITFLDGLKGGRSHWAAGVIAGETQCTSDFGDAVEAKRLKTFVTMANANGTTQAVFSSICAGDLTAGLQSSLDTFQDACNRIVGRTR